MNILKEFRWFQEGWKISIILLCWVFSVTVQNIFYFFICMQNNFLYILWTYLQNYPVEVSFPKCIIFCVGISGNSNYNAKSIPVLFLKIGDETSGFLIFLQWLFPSWRSRFYYGKITLTSTNIFGKGRHWGGFWFGFSFQSPYYEILLSEEISPFLSVIMSTYLAASIATNWTEWSPYTPSTKCRERVPPLSLFHHCELFGSNKCYDLCSENVYMCGLNSDA